MKTKSFLLLLILVPVMAFAQNDLQNALKGGELILSGLSIFKAGKSNNNSKVIENLCVKNKLTDRIMFKLTGKSQDGDEIKKELVIPKDGKECLLQVPKGIYTYEITLPTKEVYKKGEYKFDEDTVLTIRQDN